MPGQNAAEADSPSALRFSARLPLRFDPLPKPLPTAPLEADIRWQGAVEPLWKLLPLPGRSLSGQAEVQARLLGSLKALRWQGRVALKEGRFVDSLEGVALRDMALLVEHQGDLGNVGNGATASLANGATALLPQGATAPLASQLTFSAGDGRGGSLRLQGDLAQRGPHLWVEAKGSLDKLRPLHRDDLQASLSGELQLSGPLLTAGPAASLGEGGDGAALLQGNVRLDKGSFTLLQGFAPSVRSLDNVQEGRAVPPPLAAPATALTTVKVTTGATVKMTAQKKTVGQAPASRPIPAAPPPSVQGGGLSGLAAMRFLPPRLQLHITAPGQFFIKGKGLDSEWKADLSVQGTALAPRLLGNLQPVRGVFELLGRQFRFERGSIDFNGNWPPDPALNLALAFKNPHITALVLVQGRAQQPRLELTSEPPLPRDEVMAQVLFGKNMASLSRFEAIQAANSARQLVDLGPSALDVLGTVRTALGLEVLRFGSSSSASTANTAKRAPRDASLRGSAATGSADAQDNTTLEAGKYLTDNVYVGVEQGMRPETSAVRVEVELTPNVSVSGRTSQESSGLGLNWKLDY